MGSAACEELEQLTAIGVWQLVRYMAAAAYLPRELRVAALESC